MEQQKAPDTKQCEGCIYWKEAYKSGNAGGLMMYHYMLVNERRREKNGDICLSRFTLNMKGGEANGR